jgi:hypothetical protein
MLACYGVDVHAAGLSSRRLWVLLKRLPPYARVGADTEQQWSQESYLLAAVVDAVQNLSYITMQVWSKSKVKPPKPLPRPGDRTKKRSDPMQGQQPVSGLRGVLRTIGQGVKPRGW